MRKYIKLTAKILTSYIMLHMLFGLFWSLTHENVFTYIISIPCTIILLLGVYKMWFKNLEWIDDVVEWFHK